MRVSSIWARANPIHMCGPRPNGSQAWSVMVFCSGVMSANRSGSAIAAGSSICIWPANWAAPWSKGTT